MEFLEIRRIVGSRCRVNVTFPWLLDETEIRNNYVVIYNFSELYLS